ncbi:MAG: dihydropteroate synthase [Clostridia bacterium]|nr:dihydropteroate synthase [Clostridia bacterium]
MEINKRSAIKRVIEAKGRTLILDGGSKIMGIINLTPDSFSDGGEYNSIESALNQGIQMEKDGAHILDIGAESSRPGHEPVSTEEEIKRLHDPLELILANTTIPVSIDTWKHEVAEFALEKGASIINDIYGLKRDPLLAPVIAKHNAGIVIMHNNENKEYPEGLLYEIKKSLIESIEIALSAGISKDKIILDPGIGFAKDPEQNIKVMNNLFQLKELGYPLLLGVSRKSVIGSVVNVPPKDRLPGTIASTVLGILQGFDIFRVHDVKENLQAAVFTDKIIQS